MDLFGTYKTDEEVNEELVSQINGLVYKEHFLTETEERTLIDIIDKQPWLDDLKRKVQHYGYKYDYRARKINQNFRLGKLPDWSKGLCDKLLSKGVVDFIPDQIIVNNYEPGQGIAMHVDCEPCFSETIISLSLASDTVMDIKNIKSKEKISILLKRRSLLVFSNESRYLYEHGIASRKSDKFNESKRNRERRISLTFRKVILE
ncbi:alpha-ketoglutarate-dependent dioxygenase AlkB [Cellulophaga sp. 20_2_10]|uniref:alpha-ketoglutarate-dependent dioxygenase AlkB n=1 Tax=Cellulophaga sp. 20_2_10 TaxID=2942476 RepID=UPI00201A57CF|nr:alpha-ketoglutarate-dependent dioxygenase AlkB [Cellulophaga sp. 20_2_10]MCL5246841.1 alpha-ketoglutarate-dependent dioxygenase AlkB [Cellulophaga sp. 20_2_10]